MRKLLIADRSLADALGRLLSEQFEIRYCTRDDQVLQQITRYQPDVLVLDLMLTDTDGLSVLHAAHSIGIRPVTIVTTCYVSDYVLQALEKLQVSYLMMKPCNVQALASRILDAAGPDTSCNGEALRTELELLFLALGLRRKLAGYKYLVEAVLLYYNNPEQSLTKELYPEAARILGGTAQQAERAIRTCIQDAYMKRSERIWHIYFPAGKDGRVRRITNANFIATVANCLHKSIDK